MVLKDYSIEEIAELSDDKPIIFCGTGKLYERFQKAYYAKLNSKNIFCAVDNDKLKQGTEIGWGKKKIPIRSAGEAALEIGKNALYIITAAAGYDIYMQLNSIDALKDVECCYCKFIIAKTEEIIETERAYPLEFKRTEEQIIPKTIHYCWFGGSPLPKQYQGYMKTWKEFCPDYEIIRWDESNYDYSWSPYMREAYECKKWAFVSDLARLDIVYRYGGIYLDTDVEIIRSLDELLYQESYFGIESGGWVATGLGFGARPHHPAIKELINMYEGRHFMDRNGVMDLTSCPVLQRPCFEKMGFLFDGNLFITENTTIYPEWVLCPQSLYSWKIHITESTFSIHHYDCSWNVKTKELFTKDKELRKEIKSIA